MFFSLLFSFFYGFGAIFILTWNASVIGAAIGGFIKSNVSQNYLLLLPIGIFRYMIHGFPEIMAYFVTALAGGIFGIGVIRHGIKDKKGREGETPPPALKSLTTCLLSPTTRLISHGGFPRAGTPTASPSFDKPGKRPLSFAHFVSHTCQLD